MAYLKTVTPEFHSKDKAAEEEIAKAFQISRIDLNIRKLVRLFKQKTDAQPDIVTTSMLMNFMDIISGEGDQLNQTQKAEAWFALSDQLLESIEKVNPKVKADLQAFKWELRRDIDSVTNAELNIIVAERSTKMFELQKYEQAN